MVKRKSAIRRIREIDSTEFFKEDVTPEALFLNLHSSFKHEEACEFILYCNQETIENAVKYGCGEEFISILKKAARAGIRNEDAHWIWFYC